MNKDELAESLYHGEQGYNCAQAILKTFQEEFNIQEEEILDAASKGRGRVEDGTCGALYAALQLVKTSETQSVLKDSFITEGGSTRCKDIRIGRKLNCNACVKLAAKTIESHL